MFDMVSPVYDHLAARNFFASSLQSSIDYLIDFYELPDILKSPPLSWRTCAVHYLAARCAEAEDHTGAITYLKLLNTLPAVAGMAVLPLTSADASAGKEMMLKIIRDDCELAFGFCDDPPLATAETTKIYHALEVIRQYVPAAYDEITTYLHAVYLTCETVDGTRFMLSGTNFYMWGMMFAYVHEKHTVPYYVDILAHECGHTALNILNSFDELVLNNPSETYDSSLRVDKRPMIGIFHALFVLSRICYVFDQIIRENSSQYVEECRERFAVAFRKLQDTQAIVRQHAKFTDIGQDIYSGICRLWGFT